MLVTTGALRVKNTKIVSNNTEVPTKTSPPKNKPLKMKRNSIVAAVVVFCCGFEVGHFWE